MSDTPVEDFGQFEELSPEQWRQLAGAGWGEGDGQDPHVPDGLLELFEVLEWQGAVDAAGGGS